MSIVNKATLSSNMSKQGQTLPATSESNSNIITILSTDVIVTKSTEKLWTIKDDTFTIKTKITNNTNFDIENFYLKDVLSSDANFKAGSVRIESEQYQDANPIDGYTFPVTIGAGVEIDLMYDITIVNNPTSTAIETSGQITLTIEQTEHVISSNQLSIPIETNEIYILKSANTNIAKVGDVITYTITISNEGTLLNTDLILTDELSEKLSFVNGSVKINDQSFPEANPANGIQLENIDTNQQIKIQFEASVVN